MRKECQRKKYVLEVAIFFPLNVSPSSINEGGQFEKTGVQIPLAKILRVSRCGARS